MARKNDTQLYDLLTTSKCYIDTVDPVDKQKVIRARQQGVAAPSPGSKIGQVAQELGLRAWEQKPPPPPPPPPPPDRKALFFPRTFNKEGGSDARFCVKMDAPQFSHVDSRGRLVDKGGGVYDSNGLCDGGRDPNYISKREDGTPLRGAKTMDSFGPCDLYDGLKEWPPDSYNG